jgi:hypothetical protein
MGFAFMLLIGYLWTRGGPKKQFSLNTSYVKDTALVKKPEVNMTRLKQKAKAAKAFCTKRGFNDRFCILIDMSLHSGLKRFFVWDLIRDSVSHRFVVAHGCCDGPWSYAETKDSPGFSNKDGSHCSSLGKYSLGKRAYSEWGVNIKYIMRGLEATNSNAENRLIVFHSWDQITDEEVYPQGTVEGWGCPTISNNSFRLIDPMIKTSKKPVLMWIFKD